MLCFIASVMCRTKVQPSKMRFSHCGLDFSPAFTHLKLESSGFNARTFKKQQTGFTLLELLVVIVLLGIITSFTMLSINQSGLESKLGEEAQKLYALIKLAKEEAIIQSEELVLEMDAQSYVFLSYDYLKKEWEPLANKIFRQREITAGLKMRLDIELNESIFKNKDDDEAAPQQVYFLSSGEQTGFIITMALEENEQIYYEFTGELNGNVKIEEHMDTDF